MWSNKNTSENKVQLWNFPDSEHKLFLDSKTSQFCSYKTTNQRRHFIFFVGRRGRTKQKSSLALASLLGQKKRLQAEILNSNKNSGKKKADKKNISTFSRKTTGKVFTLSKKLSVLFGIHSTWSCYIFFATRFIYCSQSAKKFWIFAINFTSENLPKPKQCTLLNVFCLGFSLQATLGVLPFVAHTLEKVKREASWKVVFA